MFIIPKNFPLILAIATLTACSSSSWQAKNENTEKRAPATHTWGGYHWARTTPQFTLKLGDNLTTANWKSHLATTSANWNNPVAAGATFTPVITKIVAGQTTSKCRAVTGKVQVCNGTYGKNGWLGLAQIWLTGGEHITAGTSKMNDSYFNSSTYNNPNERQHVMCQEVAHTFGLDHQSEDGSSLNTCMDYFSNTGVNASNPASTKPNLHDFEELQEIYERLDTTTTVAGAGATAARAPASVDEDEVNENPNSWGQWMREQSHGRSAWYVRHTKDAMVLTHVYMTQEEADKCKDCDHRVGR